jgi:hypothetical protein
LNIGEVRIEQENEEEEEQVGVFDEDIPNKLNLQAEVEGPVSSIDGEEEVVADQSKQQDRFLEQEQKLPLEDDDDEEEIPVDEEDDNDKFVLVSTGIRVVSTWIGAARIDGIEYSHQEQQYNGTTELGNNEMMYYVVKLAWKKMSVAQHKEQRREKLERLRRKQLVE